MSAETPDPQHVEETACGCPRAAQNEHLSDCEHCEPFGPEAETSRYPDQHVEVPVCEEAVEKFLLELFGFHNERLIGEKGKAEQRREVQRMLAFVAPFIAAKAVEGIESICTNCGRVGEGTGACAKCTAEGHPTTQIEHLLSDLKRAQRLEIEIGETERERDQAVQQERERLIKLIEAAADRHEAASHDEHPAPWKLELAKAEGLMQFIDTLDQEGDGDGYPEGGSDG